MLQRELNILITGWAKRDFRLEMRPLFHHKADPRMRRAQRAKEVTLTVRALDLGANERGKRDGAVQEAAEGMGLEFDTALDYYKRNKRAVCLIRRRIELEGQDPS